jgi:L-asparaginase II
MDPISVAVMRGNVVEAVHRVHGVVVSGGRVVEAAGDAELVTFWRSCAKPIQAVPLVRAAPDLPVDELAIACASHEARPEQLDAVRSLLARSDGGEDDLECGPEGGSRLAHNCSGKHAGMLLACRLRGWPATGYRLPDHPLEREVHELVAAATGLLPDEIPTAVDGCGVVTFALPLRRMALAFERLAADEPAGAATAAAAMRTRPTLVGGPESVDTRLMLAVPGLVAKRGAEGLLCGALPGGSGFALKAEDGAQRPLLVAAGRLLGVESLAREPVPNSRGEEVGSVEPR